MNKESKNLFVAIPNRMFAFDTEYFVTNEELVVFYQLGLLVTARDPKLNIVNIELLNSLLKFDNKNPSRGKAKIKQALHSLCDKGYIKLVGNYVDIKNTTLLTIRLPLMEDPIYTDKVKSGSWNYTGFTEVTNDMFEKAKNINQFKVLIYIKWRSFLNVKDDYKYSISFFEWESVLNVSHATAVKIIDNCVKEGIITKFPGDYYNTLDGEIRQETNRYEVKEDKERKHLDINKYGNVIFHAEELKDKSRENRKHRWFSFDEFINENDVYIYLTTKCPILKKHASKRIEGISKIDIGKEKIDIYFLKAKRRIAYEKIEEKRIIEADKDVLLEIKNEKQAVYKKKKASYDISEFLSDDIAEKEIIDDLPFI